MLLFEVLMIEVKKVTWHGDGVTYSGGTAYFARKPIRDSWPKRFTWWVEQFFTSEELTELYKVDNGVSIAPQHLFDKYCRLQQIYCQQRPY